VSIAVACPHCDAKLNVRDELGGRRGKCPNCQQPIDIPSATTPSQAAAAPTAVATPEQIKAALSEALAAINLKPPPQTRTAAIVCQVTRGIHYLLPLVFGGALAYHVLMHGHWASGASGSPGPIPYYVLLVAGILLTAMSVLSHFGPPSPQPVPGIPLDDRRAPLLNVLLSYLAGQLQTPPMKAVTVWDARLHDDHGQLAIGASSLGNLSVAELLGVMTRELAVYRSADRRTVRGEHDRLSRLQGEREPGERVSLVGKLAGALGALGRPVTWPLLVMVKTFGESELRQAEFDADAIACDLVGSRSFLQTIQRRRLIDYATEMTAADIAYQFQDRSLRANRVRMVTENMQTLPSEVQQSILETQVEDQHSGGYWPTWSERIAAIQKQAAPGTLKCSVPARLLVADFEALCKEVTWLDYGQRFGAAVERKDLK
jgi:hypothetical protein